MNTGSLFTLIALMLLFSAPRALAYDPDLADSYARLFDPVSGAKAGKALYLVQPAMLVDQLNRGERIVFLDVRTPKEAGLYTIVLPGSMAIPLNGLFTRENLDRLPTGKKIVVLCKSGTRATAAGTALRHIGFDNVYILKGGFKALAAYMGPKEAYSTPETQKVSMNQEIPRSEEKP